MAIASSAHPLTLIGQRRARSLAGARNRSRFVRRLRIALAGAIGLVAVNALVQVSLSGGGRAGGAAFVPVGSSERIVSPRFTGRDDRGVPFTITADAAVRRQDGRVGVTELERPALDYALFEAAADASQVLAQAGEYDDVAQTLRLRTAVRLTTRSGYVFETEEALLRLDEGVVIGESAVFGRTPWGAMRADGFEVRDEGRRIILTGDVRTRIVETAAGAPRAEENEG